MTAADPGRPWRWGRILLVLMLLLMAVEIVEHLSKRQDFDKYVEVAEHVLADRDIYEDPSLNTWPPFFSVAAIPAALVSRIDARLARGLWGLVLVAALFGSLHLSLKLVHGTGLALRGDAGRIAVTSLAAVAPLVITLRYWYRNFEYLQVNAVILLLSLAGCWLVLQGRSLRGGALVGLAVSLKVLPVLLLPYFAFKRWWTAFASAVIATVALSASPMLVFGPARWWEYVTRWVQYMRETDYPASVLSQSVYSVVDRWVGHGLGSYLPSGSVMNYVALHRTIPDSPSGEWWVVALTILLLGGAATAIALSARRGGQVRAGRAVTIELAAVFALMPLVPSFGRIHYFVFLLPAAVVLWHAASAPSADTGLGASQRSAIRWLLAISVLLWVPTSGTIMPSRVGYAAVVLGAVAASTLVVLGALVYLRLGTGPRR